MGTIKFKSGEAGPSGTDLNRYAGGAGASSSDHPYVKGYFYVFFGLPTQLFITADADANISADKSAKFLLVSAEGYTPPGDRQINTQDIQGQGGVDASYITGQTITREFSIQYKDTWGAPIFRIHRNWTSYINPYTGTSDVATNFSSSEYKGTCMVIQTKPIRKSGDKAFKADDIIKVDLFDGVQCLTDLKSAYDANIASNDFVKPSVQYKFDGFPLDETYIDANNKYTVVEAAVEILNSKKDFNFSTQRYDNLAKNAANKMKSGLVA